MIKIKIMKPGSTVVVDYEEAEADKMFKGIAATLLGLNGKTPGEERKREGREHPVPENAPAQVAAEDRPAPVQMKAHVKEPERKEKHLHGGFLYIKCEHCGNERAYCQKQSSEYSICTKCGSRTYFGETLRQLYLTCECGQKSRYHTNMTEEMFDINCISCGSPVAVKYNQKRNCYETIK